MPAWWSRKSNKTREDAPTHHPSPAKSSIKSDAKRKPNSFDDVVSSRNSPRNSRDFGGTAGGPAGEFAGFDSDRGLPLPRPSVSSVQDPLNGSVSVSSVSSSGSSDDHQLVNGHAQLGVQRGLSDAKCTARPRSPGPCSRGPTSPTSPLHTRLSGFSLDSPQSGRHDDSRSQCHPLPLPPGSPTSPSSLPNNRNSGAPESPTFTLSKWKKGRLLGRGTFGQVYLGFNSEGGKMCAIKEVRIASDDQTLKESFKQLNQEINLLSQLRHPNIVRYFGSELGEDTLSVYLEYVSGGSIHKLLQEYGAFEEPVIQNYTRQITSGLAYLHGRNVVHRDIKGANILVDPNGEIKLVDFGMAKHITSCQSMLSFKGSPYWMAPEVVMNTNGYNLAVDLWSLGCTVLEMATSKPPWSQYEGVAAIFKIGNSKDMPEIPDHLSNDAKSFIRLCLQREPSARPTAAQLLDHPFIRDLATSRVSNISITRNAFPSVFEGTRTPPALDLHPNRGSVTPGSMTPPEVDYPRQPVGMVSLPNRGSVTPGSMTPPEVDYTRKPAGMLSPSRGLRSPRNDVRMITSLPVSPSSSPLRHFGNAHRSGFLSPPHPAYAPAGQSAYTLNDYSIYPTRPNTRQPLDPWHETALFSSRTPSGSPRRALI
ncbi:mitogen-activated protein kinase kinase kinase 3 isoform X2 [Rhodamnia argentea]|uniref:mitogen-activated protein kinase kinase kinase n=1 Tax=Rhodamnia argentea TaxID=178133 RepID=A0A8B8MN06_9MYRT|nr:mitogen-activated protein kinase kinase kinase 3 isoform X2 [Rhodamnia argentea]